MKKIIILLIVVSMLALTSCSLSAAKEQETIPTTNPYLILVNSDNRLPGDWLDQVDLRKTKNSIDDREFLVERVTLQQFQALRKDLLHKGIDIEINSAYRSVDEQIALWEEYEEKYGEGYCQQYLAVPGYSEHHTGLAIDICLVKDGKIIDDKNALLAETEFFDQIHQELMHYGFIVRYPEGKIDITGHSYEPWHLRYVGIAAQEINRQGISLEEYLG